MTKQQIKATIRNLQEEDEVLRDRRDAIRDKYDRPTQWMKDSDYQEISRARIAIEEKLDGLNTTLGEIEDQEWADRMADAYPDGEV